MAPAQDPASAPLYNFTAVRGPNGIWNGSLVSRKTHMLEAVFYGHSEEAVRKKADEYTGSVVASLALNPREAIIGFLGYLNQVGATTQEQLNAAVTAWADANGLAATTPHWRSRVKTPLAAAIPSAGIATAPKPALEEPASLVETPDESDTPTDLLEPPMPVPASEPSPVAPHDGRDLLHIGPPPAEAPSPADDTVTPPPGAEPEPAEPSPEPTQPSATKKAVFLAERSGVDLTEVQHAEPTITESDVAIHIAQRPKPRK